MSNNREDRPAARPLSAYAAKYAEHLRDELLRYAVCGLLGQVVNNVADWPLHTATPLDVGLERVFDACDRLARLAARSRDRREAGEGGQP